ncbi:Clu domain-containing protein [Balamuthia mandrillaris]
MEREDDVVGDDGYEEVPRCEGNSYGAPTGAKEENESGYEDVTASLLSGEEQNNCKPGGEERASTARDEAKGDDWDSAFQHYLERLKELEDNCPLSMQQEVYDQIKQLAMDFMETAKLYGTIIIREQCLPDGEKTIPPASAGGIAGGEKYIVRKILFKFARDTSGLYNNDAGLAGKVASHELKGLGACLNSRASWSSHKGSQSTGASGGLCFPLACLIDHRGFRLLASALLPISGVSTLVYGSADGGRTVFSPGGEDDDALEQAKGWKGRIKALAVQLNLKEHVAGSRPCRKPQRMYMPADIEGHYVKKTNRFYLLDFARVFPAEYPLHFPAQTGSNLYWLLRPELVKTNPVPLCSDALSGFQIHDTEQRSHNKEVEEATKRLIQQVIPAQASLFEADPHYLLSLMRRRKLSFELHKRGINMRYLGLLRSLVSRRESKHLLLIEMIARCSKTELRAALRLQLHHQSNGLGRSQEAHGVIADHLNLLFGDSPASAQYWDQVLLPMLTKKYVGGVEELEQKDEKKNQLSLKTIFFGQNFNTKQTSNLSSSAPPTAAASSSPSAASTLSSSNSSSSSSAISSIFSSKSKKTKEQQQQRTKKDKKEQQKNKSKNKNKAKKMEAGGMLQMVIGGIQSSQVVAMPTTSTDETEKKQQDELCFSDPFASLALLFHRLKEMAQLECVPHVDALDREFFTQQLVKPFHASDIQAMGVRVKHLNIVHFALGFVLKARAIVLDVTSPGESRKYFQLLSSFFSFLSFVSRDFSKVVSFSCSLLCFSTSLSSFFVSLYFVLSVLVLLTFTKIGSRTI